ncbi:MAG: VCBS repeat-containing protein [Opitutales bacterium]|nr:VCBS repeat-containing protein [Opitutales bacterium]
MKKSKHHNPSFLLSGLLAVGMLFGGNLSLQAIINPNFTPRDLVRSSELIQQAEAVYEEEAGQVILTFGESLKGEVFDEETITLIPHTSLQQNDLEVAFQGEGAVFSMFFSGGEKAGGDSYLLQVGTVWFQVEPDGGAYALRSDDLMMNAVWGGSARMLDFAVRKVIDDPWAQFAVQSDLLWYDEMELEPLEGSPHRAKELNLGGEMGRGILVLSEYGDQFYALPEEYKEDVGPENRTESIGLATSSQRAVVVNWNGNDWLDLVTWDGEAVWLQTVDPENPAQLQEPRKLGSLAECLSLEVISRPGGEPALLAGTSSGPRLLWEEEGEWKERSLVENDEDFPGANRGPGGYATTGDFTGNGFPDVMQLFAEGFLLFEGQGEGEFAAPQVKKLRLPRNPVTSVVGNFSNNGKLELFIGGENGLAYLARHEGDTWEDLLVATYELGHHGNMGNPRVGSMNMVDINGDGTQGVALFYPEYKQMTFFNRTFACFGWARELDVDAPTHAISDDVGAAGELTVLGKLARGQAAGVMTDVTGNGFADLFAVRPGTHEVLVALGERSDSRDRLSLELRLPADQHRPVTVTVLDEDFPEKESPLAMVVLRPGHPVVLQRSFAGPVQLHWHDAEGQEQEAEVAVIDPVHTWVVPD